MTLIVSMISLGLMMEAALIVDVMVRNKRAK